MKKWIEHMPGGEKKLSLKELNDHILKDKKGLAKIQQIRAPRDKDDQVISPKEKGVSLISTEMNGKIQYIDLGALQYTMAKNKVKNKIEHQLVSRMKPLIKHWAMLFIYVTELRNYVWLKWNCQVKLKSGASRIMQILFWNMRRLKFHQSLHQETKMGK